MTDQLTDLDLLSHQCLPYLKRSSLELLLHIHDAHQGVSSAVLPLRSVELDRDKTTVRDECGSAGIRLWDEPTAGVNDQTLKTQILKSLWPCCPWVRPQQLTPQPLAGSVLGTLQHVRCSLS